MNSHHTAGWRLTLLWGALLLGVTQSMALAAHALPLPDPESALVRLSIGKDGLQGNGDSFAARGSADCQVIVFQSLADNFYLGDSNETADIFLLELGDVPTVVSLGLNGEPADGESRRPALSADGSTVAFESRASNLTPDTPNGFWNIFLYHRPKEELRLITRGMDGPANGASYRPALSADGNLVVFESDASNLTPSDTNGVRDIFLYTRDTGELQRLSVNPTQGEAEGISEQADISADGQYIVFTSWASTLDEQDTNAFGDIYLYDRALGKTNLVSLGLDGAPANHTSSRPALSADGQVIAYESLASNLVVGDSNQTADVFIYDRATQTTQRASLSSDGEQGSAASGLAALSADGHYVVFASFAHNLTPNDTNWALDVFGRDLSQGVTERLSRLDWRQGNGASNAPAISGDARYVLFESAANNLVTGDTNQAVDILLLDRQVELPQRLPRLFFPVAPHKIEG